MRTTDKQVRKFMEELSKHGEIGLASMKAGMDRKTGRKYAAEGKLPSELRKPRWWRTRKDPFEQDWPTIEKQLEEHPELEAKTIFEELVAKHPERYQEGQMRTLQRRIKKWRASHGPDKEVFFVQQHRPGEAMQTDFTGAQELRITICGVLFLHMLCNVVLPYSDWQWVTVCLSESLAALRRGVQAALFRLGRVPRYHQTDNSTAATHEVKPGKRSFNAEYLGMMRHFGMEPRTIEVGHKEQNGDVEASNGAFKRRLEQQLLVRGSRDFESREAWEQFVQEVAERSNRSRQSKLAEELAQMKPLEVGRLREYRAEQMRVSPWSTIRVMHNAYSVPSRLIGEVVEVRVYEDHIEVVYDDKVQMNVERILERNGHRVNYRHVIWSLV